MNTSVRHGWRGRQPEKCLFGGTTFSLPPEGTKESLESITLEDVKAFYRRYYTPNGADIVVVGDIDKTQLTSSLGFLADWQGMPKADLCHAGVADAMPKQTVWLVDKPGAPQTVIRLARQGLPLMPPVSCMKPSWQTSTWRVTSTAGLTSTCVKTKATPMGLAVTKAAVKKSVYRSITPRSGRMPLCLR